MKNDSERENAGNYADGKEVRGWIETLACSQGFYGRLLVQMDNTPGSYEQLAAEGKFTDMLDMVIFLEVGA